MEKIEIGYQPMGKILGRTYYHKYIIYTNKNNEKRVLRAGPDGYVDSSIPKLLILEKLDNIRMEVSESKYSDSSEYLDQKSNKEKHKKEIIAQGDDLSSKYKKLKDFGNRINELGYAYNAFTQNCNTFNSAALESASLPKAELDNFLNFNDFWSPGSDHKMSDKYYNKYLDKILDNPYDLFFPYLNPFTSLTIYDPLILDLDGDGIETTTLKDGVYFDHNGDDISFKTSWVDKDDALLVLDKNLNNQIDNGNELFGNFTEISNPNNSNKILQLTAFML